MQSRLHTVVLDLDDTLFLERDFVLSGFRAVDTWLINTHRIRGFYPLGLEMFFAGIRRTIFDRALARLGHVPEGDIIAQMIEVYRSHRPTISMLPDAVAFLTWAQGRCHLALITDGFAGVQARKIEALGLGASISLRILTDELGREHWKPSPLAYKQVMERFPGAAEGYVYVGDNPRKDFIGAKFLGWRTVRIRRSQCEHAAYEPAPHEASDVEIVSLMQLPELFDIRIGDAVPPK